jgi:hypothetical protein
MSIIVEFTVPSRALAMHRTLEAAPETIVEIERVVAHPNGRLTPYFWIRGGDREAFERTIDTDPSVDEYTRLDVHEDTTLYRADWTQDVDSITHAYLETGATILEATGRHRLSSCTTSRGSRRSTTIGCRTNSASCSSRSANTSSTSTSSGSTSGRCTSRRSSRSSRGCC